MLAFVDQGSGDPALILMHFYGGSHREWDVVAPKLAARHRVVAIDTPGFGASSAIAGYSVEAMADQFADAISKLGLTRYVLVGHSMTCKVAMAMASLKPAGLQSLILVTPSPPGPEPIPDDARKTMLTEHNTRESAEKYVDSCTYRRLPDALREPMVEGAQNCSPRAWLAWADAGSREDWSERVGILDYPTLVIAAMHDASLAAPVQEKLTMPHLRNGRLVVVADSGHLIPLEQPSQLASMILSFVSDTGSYRG